MPTDTLFAAFAAHYGEPPTHLARAPGRVNLIGEHIDYAGLPVFPMAIQREIRIAFRPIEEPEVRIASHLAGLDARTFRLDGSIEPYPGGDWGNYPKAAAHGLQQAGVLPGGLEALVASDLPVAAGLSSSSALVVACALALLEAGGDEMEPLELAELMARAEHFTGTRGGGMDQAICLCAREGAASIIEFDPLRAESVPIPDGWSFIVAHSLVEARKSGEAQETYNRLRADVETAVSAVGDAIGAPAAARELLDVHGPDALLEAADLALAPDIRPRFRHVVTEAGRVRRARDAMQAADIYAFGELMNASHRSLRDDFEVSTPELDELVAIALEAGAAGARLTGAGLGGAIVALTDADRVDHLLSALAERFYSPRLESELDIESVPGAATRIGERNSALEDVLFVAVPSAGASVECAP